MKANCGFAKNRGLWRWGRTNIHAVRLHRPPWFTGSREKLRHSPPLWIEGFARTCKTIGSKGGIEMRVHVSDMASAWGNSDAHGWVCAWSSLHLSALCRQPFGPFVCSQHCLELFGRHVSHGLGAGCVLPIPYIFPWVFDPSTPKLLESLESWFFTVQ